ATPQARMLKERGTPRATSTKPPEKRKRQHDSTAVFRRTFRVAHCAMTPHGALLGSITEREICSRPQQRSRPSPRRPRTHPIEPRRFTGKRAPRRNWAIRKPPSNSIGKSSRVGMNPTIKPSPSKRLAVWECQLRNPIRSALRLLPKPILRSVQRSPFTSLTLESWEPSHYTAWLLTNWTKPIANLPSQIVCAPFCCENFF